MSFGVLKYYEAFDSGITFSSITNEQQAKKLQNDFFLDLKKNLQKLSVFNSHYLFSDFFAVTRKKEDTSTYIEIRHTSEKLCFNEVTLPCIFLSGHHFPSYLQPLGDDDFLMQIDYNGIVSLQMGGVSFQYSCDSRFTPNSLFIQSNNGISEEDNLPIAAKALDIAVASVAQHITYDPKRNAFSIPQNILYAGLSQQNLLAAFIDYLNEKFLDFLEKGKPQEYRIFPEDIEKRFSELTFWHPWSNEQQNFTHITETGDVMEKRPADFLHCLLLTIQNGKFLMRKGEEEIRDTQKRILTTIFEIIYDLLKNREQIFSVEQSMAEYRYIVENDGYDPLQKMVDVHESCMNLSTGEFAFYLLLARKIYAQIEITRQNQNKKIRSFLIRESTYERGLGMDEYAIIVNESNQKNEPLFYAAKMAAFDRALRLESAGFSLLRITETLNEQMKEPSLPSISYPEQTNHKIFLTNYPDVSQLSEYYKNFFQNFRCHAFITATNHAFNNQGFKLSQLTYVRNILRLQKNSHKPLMQLFPSDKIPYDLISEANNADQILQVKQEIKQSLLDVAKRKTESTFNFALAIFGAFGVASSVVSILLSDNRSIGISVLAMLLYLIIVAISYRRWDE
ncbi:MAG: hypothetical protein IJX28_00925 [Clostridia bacterium]|nr:hypothetical protein [Clostridia bacterium]